MQTDNNAGIGKLLREAADREGEKAPATSRPSCKI